MSTEITRIQNLPRPAQEWQWFFSLQNTNPRGQQREQQRARIPTLENSPELIQLSAQQVSTEAINVETDEFSASIYNSPFIKSLSNNTGTLALVENRHYDIYRMFNEWISLAVNTQDTVQMPDGMVFTDAEGTVNPPVYYQIPGVLHLVDTTKENVGPENAEISIIMEKITPQNIQEIDYSYESEEPVIYNFDFSFEKFRIED